MKYLLILILLVGCSKDPKTFIGKCYKPYVYNGEVIKVLACTQKEFYENGGNFCVIERKHPRLFLEPYTSESTIFIRSLEDYSIEVSCSEY